MYIQLKLQTGKWQMMNVLFIHPTFFFFTDEELHVQKHDIHQSKVNGSKFPLSIDDNYIIQNVERSII